MSPRRLLLPLGLGALAACVPARPLPWIPTEPSFVAAGAGFELVPPPGWMRLNVGAEVFVITHDGTPLQRMGVGASEIGKPTGLGKGKRSVQASMTPQELAELVIDDIRASEALTEARVLENAPAPVGGRKGFRVLATFRDARGLARKIAIYGLLDEKRFYRLFYVAPERHYFARDLPVFEELVRSFRLRAVQL